MHGAGVLGRTGIAVVWSLEHNPLTGVNYGPVALGCQACARGPEAQETEAVTPGKSSLLPAAKAVEMQHSPGRAPFPSNRSACAPVPWELSDEV